MCRKQDVNFRISTPNHIKDLKAIVYKEVIHPAQERSLN